MLARRPGSAHARALAERFGAELRGGDVLDPRSLDGALDGAQVVIHLVGIIGEARTATFEAVHVRGTENLVRAAQRAGVTRFVHMSALSTRPNAVSRYHCTKWDAEQAVRHSGLPFTIFRPSLIYGRQDQFVNLFVKFSRFSPILPILGSGRARFQPVSVSTVAEAFVKSLPDPAAIGQTYDLCGPDRLTLAQIVDCILAVTGAKRLKLRIPSVLARAQVALLQAVYAALPDKAPPLNRDQLIMLDEDQCGNPQPANDRFGLRPEGFRQGIERYLGTPARRQSKG
jgi:uncharacterized protein YbjT (DUF2867 family)